MIKLPWKREARPLEPKITVNPRLLELQTAKQILEKCGGSVSFSGNANIHP